MNNIKWNCEFNNYLFILKKYPAFGRIFCTKINQFSSDGECNSDFSNTRVTNS